jgi:hypothetical protein
MDNINKKKYEKPKVTRIKLDAKCAVLAVCKTTGLAEGPGPNCKTFPGLDLCKEDGS